MTTLPCWTYSITTSLAYALYDDGYQLVSSLLHVWHIDHYQQLMDILWYQIGMMHHEDRYIHTIIPFAFCSIVRHLVGTIMRINTWSNNSFACRDCDREQETDKSSLAGDDDWERSAVVANGTYAMILNIVNDDTALMMKYNGNHINDNDLVAIYLSAVSGAQRIS